MLVLFLAFCSFQVLFFLFIHGPFVFTKRQSNIPHSGAKDKEGLSIVVCAKNEAQNLKILIPKLLEQDYPNFEILIVDDGSTDATCDVVQSFMKSSSAIRLIKHKKANEERGKRSALRRGIEESHFDKLVLTDADCVPASQNWLKVILAGFSDSHSIVLGYGPYQKEKGILNGLLRYETMVTAKHYFAFAQIDYAYMGVGRNLAYSKSLYNRAGDLKERSFPSGDDDLNVSAMARATKVAWNVEPLAFTISKAPPTFGAWMQQKARHYRSSWAYGWGHKSLLGLFNLAQCSIWPLFIFGLFLVGPQITLILAFLVRFLLQILITSRASAKLKEGFHPITIPFWDGLYSCFLILQIPLLLFGKRKWK